MIKTEIVLNESQSIVLKELIDWSAIPYKEKTNQFRSLIGSAGTGKTTITNEFINKCAVKYGIVVSAPTHQAKKVIERATGLTSYTIQKLLGLRPNTELENFNINFPQFEALAEKEIQKHRLVIIDESSMLNKDLHDLIIEEATRYNVKVLFIGDELQLPPVNEIMSKSLTDHPKSVLSVIVRQKDTNPLADLLIALRNDIVNKTYTFETLIQQTPRNINDNEEGYEVLNAKEFGEKLNKEFSSSSFSLDKEYCKYTAWTNDSIGGANKMIRSCISDSKEPLQIGDLIKAYNTVQDYHEGLFITNSEEYVVTDLMTHINNCDIEGFLIQMKSLDTDMPTPSLFVVNPNDYSKFLKIHNELLQDAQKYKGQAWTRYYAFKNFNLLLTDIKDSNGKLIVKKDIDYGYGCTVHKTQGSTYENIFVNLKNIKINRNLIEQKKLMYVALSRAKKRAYIYTN